ncbi:hypothetical protein FPV67DRAFT_1489277 [Lyophyllum atratum]|nr:hypothetical protein FPV67DRAFT_1489277 [Lyophyllum atratum]
MSVVEMTPTSSSTQASPAIPPAPSFSDFKFSIIGQPPQLLKRLATPAPDFRPPPTSSQMQVEHPSPSTPSYSPVWPSSFQRLESEDNSSHTFQKDMFIPGARANELAAGQKPIAIMDSVLRSSLSRSNHADPEATPSQPQRPHGVPLVIDSHNYVDSASTALGLATNTSSQATTVIHNELPLAVPSVSPPFHTLTSSRHLAAREKQDSPSGHRPSVQRVLQLQSSLAVSYESALLAFERAERALALAHETYDAARASLSATAKARAHFHAMTILDHDEWTPHTRQRGVMANDLEATNKFSRSTIAEQVQDQSTKETKDHQHLLQLAGSQNDSSILSGVLTKSLNHHVTDLEREADDARLAWSSYTVEKLSGTADAGLNAALMHKADVQAGLIDGDQAPDLRGIAHIGVPVGLGASSSHWTPRASGTLPVFVNLAADPLVPGDRPQQSETRDKEPSSLPLLPTTSNQSRSSQAATQALSLGVTLSMLSADRAPAEKNKEESNTEHRRGPIVDFPKTHQSTTASAGNDARACLSPIHPRDSLAPRYPGKPLRYQAPQLAMASAGNDARACLSPIHPRDSLAPRNSGKSLQYQASPSAFPDTSFEDIVDKLAGVYDDEDSHADIQHLKHEETDPDLKLWTESETQPLHNRDGGLWSVKKDEDDEVVEGWNADLRREQSASGLSQINRRSSVGLEEKGAVVGGDSSVSSLPSSARNTPRSPSLHHRPDSRRPSVGIHETINDTESGSDVLIGAPGKPGTPTPNVEHPQNISTDRRAEGENDVTWKEQHAQASQNVERSAPKTPRGNELCRSHGPVDIQSRNTYKSTDIPPTSGGTLLQRLQPTLGEASRSNTAAAIPKVRQNPLQTPVPVVLGKRRHADDYHHTTPPNALVHPPKRRIFTKRCNPSPPSRNEEHQPITPLESRISGVPPYTNAHDYARPPSAPRRMHNDSSGPRNGYQHYGKGTISPPAKSQDPGDGVRLGLHRLVHGQGNRCLPEGDRVGPPRRTGKEPIPGDDRRGRGGMSLADRLRDP